MIVKYQGTTLLRFLSSLALHLSQTDFILRQPDYVGNDDFLLLQMIIRKVETLSQR